MADSDIDIRLKATGGAAAAAEIGKVGDAAQGIAPKAAAAADGLEKVGDKASDLGTQKAAGGRNAGAAVLEFSRALEDAQYGIRGVLNNLPGLIAMLGGSAGLAGVISIAAVVGTQLWERMSDGPEKAKDKTKTAIETLKEYIDQLTEVYTTYEKEAQKLQDKEIEDSAKKLKGEFSATDRALKLEIGASGVEAAREKAEGIIALYHRKNELAQIENQLLKSTGEETLRLVKLREDAVKRIHETELAITETARARSVMDAQSRVEAAKKKQEEIKGPSDDLQKRFNAGQAAVDQLRQEAEDIASSRLLLIDDLKSQQDAVRQSVQNMIKLGAPVEAVAAADRQAQDQIKSLQVLIDRNNLPSPAEVQKMAEANVKQGGLEQLIPKLEASTEAQKKAANDVSDAMLDLSRLKQTQGIERDSSEFQSTVDEMKSAGENAGRKLTTELADIITKLGDAAKSPEVQAAKTTIEANAKDGIQLGEQDETQNAFNVLLEKLKMQGVDTRQRTVSILNLIDASIKEQSALDARIKELEAGMKSMQAASNQKQ